MLDIKINAGYADLMKGVAKQTAVARLMSVAAQKASPGLIKAAQQIFQSADLLQTIFGERFEDKPNPLMGHMTPRQVMELQQRIREMGPARRNLFYVQITDGNVPRTSYENQATATDALKLLALDVSYNGRTVAAEKVSIGSGLLDRPTGSESVELSITTMDDEAGSLKRWFEGKLAQVVRPDCTFGVPSDYQVDIEIVHGIASSEISPKFVARAYRSMLTMRPVGIQHELSRRDQGPEEIQMTFTSVDSWAQKQVSYSIPPGGAGDVGGLT